MKKIVVLGGTGFVGSHVVHLLSSGGYQVKVLARRREDGKHLFPLPNVQVEECDVFFETALNRALRGSDAVINLIGILHETGRNTFERIHVELPRRVAHACRTQNVPRLVHMSALRAEATAPSAYLRSKAMGELAINEEIPDGKVGVTMFRPSVIFGMGDSFLSLFARIARVMPLMVLAKPDARFQPVFVEDVAHALVASLDITETIGKTFPLCGPRVYSLRELIHYVIHVMGLRRPVIGLNVYLSYLQAWLMEWLPIKLMTRDNYYSMQVDSVCNCEFPEIFNLQPTALESVVPAYLAEDTPRQKYLRYRSRAGRSVA